MTGEARADCKNKWLAMLEIGGIFIFRRRIINPVELPACLATPSPTLAIGLFIACDKVSRLRHQASASSTSAMS
jgi:hypothetical protein